MEMGDFDMSTKRWRQGIWIVIFTGIALSVTGCTEARETMIQMRQELRQEVAMERQEDDTEEPIRQNKLEVPSVAEILQDDISIEETYEPVQTMGTPMQEIAVALYFADADGTKLVKTERKIPKVEGMARATVESLLEGPDANSGLVSAIPEGTQLLDINVKPEEKTCIVDFSQELRNQLVSGKNSEQLAVYSITNTLCQFASIDQVEFRIEGQTVATLSGTTDLSTAVSANTAIVK